MIIGDDFSKRARELLIEIAQKEAKNLFDFLEVKGFISIQNIGGAYLYSSVFITNKGLDKIRDY